MYSIALKFIWKGKREIKRFFHSLIGSLLKCSQPLKLKLAEARSSWVAGIQLSEALPAASNVQPSWKLELQAEPALEHRQFNMWCWDPNVPACLKTEFKSENELVFLLWGNTFIIPSVHHNGLWICKMTRRILLLKGAMKQCWEWERAGISAWCFWITNYAQTQWPETVVL